MSLFHHNLPSLKRREHIADLFVNRREDLEELERRCARWDDSAVHRVHAVHGDSRVGKSHLLLYFLQRPDVHRRYNVFIKRAANGRTARLVLREVYRLLAQGVPAAVRRDPDVQDRLRVYDAAAGDRDWDSGLLAPLRGTAAFERVGEIFNVSTRALDLGSLIPRADEHHLVQIILDLIDVIRDATEKPCLLYIDDMDLLDAGPRVDQQEVGALARRLEDLSESDAVTVVVSMRTRRVSRFNKGFDELLFVKPLDEDAVVEVYRRHRQVFLGDRDVFTPECVREIARAAACCVGTFLRWCARLYAWGTARLAGAGALDVLDLEEFVLDQIREYSRQPLLGRHLNRVREAIWQQHLTVDLEPDVADTELLHFAVEELVGAGQTRTFAVNPLVAKVLSERELAPWQAE